MHGHGEPAGIKFDYVRKTYFSKKICAIQIDFCSLQIADFRTAGTIKEVYLLYIRARLLAPMDHEPHQCLDCAKAIQSSNTEPQKVQQNVLRWKLREESVIDL